MARRDAAKVALKQKEAKQKKMLIALAPLFLGLVAWQGPGMYKAFAGGSTPPPPPLTAATAAPTDPAGTPPTTQGGTATTAAPGGLPDTDPQPASGIGRLISFSRFTGRDPFLKTVGTSQPVGTGVPGAEQPAALFDINGSSETVVVGGAFPASDQTFKLVSLTSDNAVVGLVNGSFEGGQDTVTFDVGQELQLVGDDGTSYTVKLVSISNST